jgi:hypothetical protein
MRSEEERSVVAALRAKYPIFAESTIRRWVAGESTRYADAKIQIYVPVLVQRIVDSTLRELARTEGTSSNALSLGEAERMAVS